MRKSRVLLLCTIGLLALLVAGCAGDAPSAQTAQANDQPEIGTYTPRSSDGVDVVYFEIAEPCECMTEVGDVIEETVRSTFVNELNSGRLRLTIVVSDDPVNEDVVQMFDAQPFDLFIVTCSSGELTARPVYEIWNLMGDNEAMAEVVAAEVAADLAGLS